jgi:UDP:flavonoid glycosyltransferase YjiC (YdhE family)
VPVSPGWGAGIDLKTGNSTQEQIVAAVRLILSDRRYLDRAKEMEKIFARYDALGTSLGLIESAIENSAWRKAEKSLEKETVLV